MDNNNREVFSVTSDSSSERSGAASFCKVLAVLTWIAGFIVAIASSIVTTVSRYGSTESSFDFVAFLTALVTYALIGGSLWCMAELFNNIQSIANSLKHIRVMMTGNAVPVVQADNASPQSEQPSASPSETLPSSESAEDKKAPAVLSGSDIKKKVKELQADDSIHWIDASQYGELGAKMKKMGLSYKQQEKAPAGISETEANEQGYVSWSLENNEKRFFKNIHFVPEISEEELETILKT